MNSIQKISRRRRAWTVATGSLVLGAMALCGPASAQVVSPQPGEVYREYTIVMSNSTGDWRVTDPTSPQAGAQAELPNPTFSFNIGSGELNSAVRAELLISYWGGHPGTTGQQFRFNNNAWLEVPDLTTTPQPPTGTDAPECFMQQWNPVAPVPLSHLRTGSNTLKGNSGPQSCYNFNWGQWGWYAAILRVYYNPAQVANPTGSIVSPIAGTTLLDNPTLSVQASGGGGIDRVEFLTRIDGYDFDGDGVFPDFQQSYHRGKSENGLEISHHVGTATGAPYVVVWDTELVPDQDAGSIQAVARIRGNNGLWYVTPVVSGLTLSRPNHSVRLFKPEDVPSRFWTRQPRPVMSSHVTVPSNLNLSAVTSAKLLVRTWNGIDGSGPGTHFTKVNGWKIPADYGENHYYSADVLDVNPTALLSGQNTISLGTTSVHHGIEILWPGPALLVTVSGEVEPYCGDGIVDPGEACDDGNLVPGDGCEADCTQTTASGGLPALFPFDGSGTTVLDVSGNGNNGVLEGVSASAARVAGGRYGSGLRFNGVSGHVDLGGLDIPGNGLTLAAWIKADDFGIEDARIISKAVSVMEQDHYWMLSTRADNNNPRLRLRLKTSNGGTETLVSDGDLTAGTWTHVAATYDGSQMRLYIDGALVASMAKTGNITQSSGAEAWIGDQPGGGKTFDGVIDEVVIDSRGYAPVEILQRMIEPLGDAGGDVCGNGLLDPGELCDDGNTIDGDGCQADCTDPECGDGIVDPGESCDDGNAAIGDGCRGNCTLEICGDGFVDPGESCDDGNTDDGDGCSAGCVSTEACGNGVVDAPGETCDPPGANAGQPNACRGDCTYCGDGILDVQPEATESIVDGGIEQWILGVPDRWAGTTDGGQVFRRTAGCFSGVSCVALSRQQPGLLRLYQNVQGLQPGQEYSLTFHAKTQAGVTPQSPAVQLENVSSGEFLQEDGSWSMASGYALRGGQAEENFWQAFSVSFTTPADAGLGDTYRLSLLHGNQDNNAIHFLYDEVSLFGPQPDRQVQEHCDDGNNVDGDGCSADCGLENCGDGVLDPGEACDDGNAVDGDGCSSDCDVESVCGDGSVDPGEECDDGNNQNGDGCSASCDVESFCGDGSVDAGEECDDGNNQNGDGCSASCDIESFCGDGSVDPGEGCDDGNNQNGDGCSSSCDVESFCGDGFVDPGEGCDDGNNRNGDGCSASCVVEVFCGNGLVEPGEACDDGNLQGGDGCSADCEAEAICGNGIVETPEPPREWLVDPGLEAWSGGSPVHWSTLTSGGDVRVNPAQQHSGVACAELRRTTSATLALYQDIEGLTPGDSYELSLWAKVRGGLDDASPQVRLRNYTRSVWLRADGSWGGGAPTAVSGGLDQLDTWQQFTVTFEVPLSHASTDVYRIVLYHATPDVAPIHHFYDDISLFGPLSDGAEECDDGNTESGDGCRPDCTLEACGDGLVDPGETCDPAADNTGLPGDCRSDCSYCGDGVIDEAPPARQWLADPGIERWWFGDTLEWTRTTDGGIAVNNPAHEHSGMSCVQLKRNDLGPLSVHQDFQGLFPEHAYELSFWFKLRSGQPGFRPSVSLENVTRQVALLGDGNWGAEEPGLVAEGIDALNTWQRFVVRFEIPPSHSVEDFYRIELAHLTAGAPDHYYDDVEIYGPVPGGANFEICDDGNSVTGDGCRADCTAEVCGDGIVDLGEECDDGNTVDGDGCTSSCANEAVCGDGVVDASETCEPNGLDDCRADCTYCGDGVVDDPGPAREFILSGGMNLWVGGRPHNWEGNSAGGDIALELAEQQSGFACAKLQRSQGGLLRLFQDIDGLAPGKTYELSFWAKVQGGVTPFNPHVRLKNHTRSLYMDADGTWSTDLSNAVRGGIGEEDAWHRFSIRFETPADHDVSDVYRLELLHGNPALNHLDHFYDNVSLQGPLPLEFCDDGNNAGGDGCSAECQLE